jgi:hypothetical protein
MFGQKRGNGKEIKDISFGRGRVGENTEMCPIKQSHWLVVG